MQSSLIYKYYINHSYVTAVFKPSVITERDHYLVVFFSSWSFCRISLDNNVWLECIYILPLRIAPMNKINVMDELTKLFSRAECPYFVDAKVEVTSTCICPPLCKCVAGAFCDFNTNAIMWLFNVCYSLVVCKGMKWYNRSVAVKID